MIGVLLALLAQVAWGCDALVQARVHTPEGPRAGWDVAWGDGRITAIGPGAGAGCRVHLVPGLEVTPGLIDVTTQLGVVEIGLEPSTRDDEAAGDPVRAAHRVALAYDARSAVIPVTRLGGLTSALVQPTGGLVSGQAAFVTLRTGPKDEAIVVPSAGVVVRPGALGSRAAGFSRLRELLEDARVHARQRDPYVGLGERSAGRLDLDALVPVTRGEVPLVVHVDRAADIEATLELAAEQRVRVVLVGGSEAWLVADRLAAARVPVVVDPLVYGPGGMDQRQGRVDNAARLHAAGVPIGLATWSTHQARALRFVAGNAVRGGLPHDAAIAAITRVPAEAFGVRDRGVLRVGAVADLAVWTGDPLEIPTRLAGLFLAGEPQALESRQTALTEAWRELPRRWWPADQAAP